jgi:hypothetical protein
MTPKEKAKDLVDKFNEYTVKAMKYHANGKIDECKEDAIECALIAVDEMIKTAKNVFEHCWNHISWKAQYDIVDMNKYLSYLEEVKQEIEKL